MPLNKTPDNSLFKTIARYARLGRLFSLKNLEQSNPITFWEACQETDPDTGNGVVYFADTVEIVQFLVAGLKTHAPMFQPLSALNKKGETALEKHIRTSHKIIISTIINLMAPEDLLARKEKLFKRIEAAESVSLHRKGTLDELNKKLHSYSFPPLGQPEQDGQILSDEQFLIEKIRRFVGQKSLSNLLKLKQNTPPNIWNTLRLSKTKYYGNTLLHMVTTLKMAALVMSFFSDAELLDLFQTTNEKKYTPLQWAIHKKRNDVALFFIDKMPHLVLENEKHKAIQLAFRVNNITILYELYEKLPNPQSIKTPILSYLLTLKKNPLFVKIHIKDNNDMFSIALTHQQDAVLKELLRYNIPITSPKTATDLIQYLLNTPETLFRNKAFWLKKILSHFDLPQKQAILNSPIPPSGILPMHLAVQWGSLDMLNFLFLENQLNPLLRDINGHTPLELAILCQIPHCVEFLTSYISSLTSLLTQPLPSPPPLVFASFPEMPPPISPFDETLFLRPSPAGLDP